MGAASGAELDLETQQGRERGWSEEAAGPGKR